MKLLRESWLASRWKIFIRDVVEHPGKWLSRLLFLLGPWAGFWIVETMNENNVFEDLYTWQVAMNMIWYYLLFVVCRLIFGRRRWASSAGILICFAIGLLNHYILRFRGRILFPADIPAWRTAANVADGFDFSLDLYMKQAIIIALAYLFLVFLCPRQKKRDKMPKWFAGFLILAVVGYSFAFFKTDMLPKMGIFTQQWVTQRNGFVLNFTTALRYSKVEKPDDYSKEAVMELMEEYPATEGDDSVTKPVNLIVIMDESFADYTVFDTFESAEDPTPFIHSLKDNTVKGWMYSPVTGGGTASVEFEYLTGFSTIFQPPHTVAYQLYVEDGMPSLAALAGTQGYYTTAFHPYKSSGWNRPIAYQYQRFDQQLYDEDVCAPYYIREYISDKSDFEMLEKLTDQAKEEGQNTFIFNVTMQNHGGYKQGWNNLQRTVQLSEDLDSANKNAAQYFALAQQTDNSLRSLIDHYSQVEEPTMIVMFGDHQPSLKNSFYKELYGKSLEDRTTQEVMQQYVTPFFIWTNYDIEEQEDVVLSTNYLGVLTYEMAGLPMTGYMNFLSQIHEELPAITPVGILTKDGKYVERDELNEEQKEWLDKYEILNYCGMIDLFDEARPMFCAD